MSIARLLTVLLPGFWLAIDRLMTFTVALRRYSMRSFVRLATWMRSLLRLTRVGVWLAAGCIAVALLFPVLCAARRARIKQAWSAGLLAALGIRMQAEAVEADCLPTGLLVANHVSFLDIFVINALLPLTFVAKREVANWPLFGWLTARTGNLFIERGHRQAAYAMQSRMAETLRSGQRLCIFPEGTSSSGEGVLPFHAALLESAIAAEAPVICLALAYQDAAGEWSAAPAFVGDDSLIECLWRIAAHPGLVARVRCVGVLPTVATHRREVAHAAHRRVAQGVARWQRQPPAISL